jgi:3-oxoacyl-[acyl-carrier protein] reductase
MELDGRAALVTGGSGVIGAAIARMLAARGIRVAVGYRQDKGASQEVARDCADSIIVPIDVTDPDSVTKAFSRVQGELGPVTVLVAAAGVIRDRPLMRMRDRDWNEVIETDLTGVFYCVRAALPGMVAARFGRIVCIGSVSSRVGIAGQANYAAAKAGLAGLVRTVAREGGRHGVTANVVAPGLLESKMTAGIPSGQLDRYRELAATGKLVDVSDAARAALMCVESASLTGQVIDVDSGFC